MYFSLTFGEDPNTRNTWEDWKLIPAAPPSVEPPQPVTNMVEIPGRRQGPIDLSKYPFGRITYQPITGSWGFLFEPNGAIDRVQKQEAIRKWLHGRRTKVRLEEDPRHYYKGTFTVSSITTGNGPSQIAIGFTLEPLRYNVIDDTEDTTWLSDWAD